MPVQENFAGQAVLPAEALPTLPTLPLSSNGEGNGKPLGSPTVPFEPSDEVEIISSPPEPDLGYPSDEQALSRLNAAARLIAEEEPGVMRLFRSRSARLKPLRDISSEIQRASTPHPSVQQQREATFDTQPEELKARPSSVRQDLWPWFAAEDEEEKDVDLWKNATDPLTSRTRPSSAEAARIEAADIQRIALEEHPTIPAPVPPLRRRRFSRWHLAFGSMVILALLALTIDGLLLTFAFNRAGRSLTPGSGPPTLVLSTNVVNVGGSVSLQLTHFAPQTSVVLTHDVQETLLTSTGSSSLTTDADGRAAATFTVSSSWGPGFHLIVAEDVATRHTASAILQVGGAGPSRPPHLLLDSSSLDLGSSVQGTNTIQPLLLRNSGNGSISWSASSDQPWLLVAPLQGTFSQGQTIEVASQRSALPPGDYTGSITLFSNVGAPEKLQVHMTVKALPPNAGPVISLVPPLLSFTTTDGSSVPVTQVVTLSNPGQQTLHWSLSNGPTSSTTMQNILSRSGNQQVSQVVDILPAPLPSWLSSDLTSGSLAPGQSVQLHLTARSQNLLPGAYMEPLTFSSLPGSPAFDTPQVIDVALTIQPHCGLLTSTGNMEFTAVKGQSNPSSHALTLSATSSCAGSALNWQAWPSAGWITVNPASGQVRGTSSGVTSIGVNTANLAPGRYSGLVTFEAGKSTQTVLVQLNLQPTPPPSEPIMGASPLSLNFSTIQGQANPPGQVITITNNGGSPLKWHSAVTQLNTNWLGASPSGGVVLPGQTGQLTVNVTTTSLTPGTYPGQITLFATDMRGSPASGSPQTVSVNLTVQPPCTLAPPSQSTLLFSAIAGGANPLAQTVTFTGAGSCTWPLHWNTNVSPAASWLSLAPASGALTTASQQGSISVGVNTGSLAPGTYSTQVMISATDSAGMTAHNSPQTFTVTLTVLQPCTLQPLPSQIALGASQGQATPASQTFTLNETGSCGGGVAWSVSGDAGSSSWLTLSPSSGTDTGSGSTVTVSASAGSLAPGTYTGSIMVAASNNGIVLQGSPQTITVTFVISAFTVSGTVVACGGPAPDCSSSSALAGATVSLVSGGTTIATVTADSAGNFTFANIPLGTYTITAQGAVGVTNYSGSTTVAVGGNSSGTVVQTFSS